MQLKCTALFSVYTVHSAHAFHRKGIPPSAATLPAPKQVPRFIAQVFEFAPLSPNFPQLGGQGGGNEVGYKEAIRKSAEDGIYKAL